MYQIRRAEDRGHFDHGWLQTWHSFSFAEYQDDAYMGFDTLRVINQDIVAPGQGFPPHGHQDMEIITYVIRGAVEHKDSMGNKEIVPAGDVQRMTAGTGVRHSEYNPSSDDDLELLQIWILPDRTGLAPGYEQRRFADTGDGLQLLVSEDGRAGSLKVHQDVAMYGAKLRAGESVQHTLAPTRSAWLQVVAGELQLDGGEVLRAGDGVAVSDQAEFAVQANNDTEFILFDLAPGPLGRSAAGN